MEGSHEEIRISELIKNFTYAKESEVKCSSVLWVSMLLVRQSGSNDV